MSFFTGTCLYGACPSLVVLGAAGRVCELIMNHRRDHHLSISAPEGAQGLVLRLTHLDLLALLVDLMSFDFLSSLFATSFSSSFFFF